MTPDFSFHSPEQKIRHPLYTQKGIEVCFKRDDMIHPFISGNKWRKLKYNLIKATEENKKHIVTFGGAWSNHILATSCAGATFGYSTEAFIRGEEVENPILTMCKLFGMQLHFVSREAYQHKKELFTTSIHRDHAYFIDEGGYGIEAVRGCKEIITELSTPYQHIFCAAGTGTTAAGLALALAENELNSQLHVVPVLKGGDFMAEEMKKLRAPLQQTILHTDYHFGGYAKTTPELIAFVKDFVAQTGVMVEPIYTGKALFALHHLIEQNTFQVGERILFIHTGGLTGLLGMLDKFN
ncbi:pyridoxal-phosphate dependent enzyme [Parapedobacter sp. SGR-10]|uniref:1-aminocyclopropane-1-carboxylate deaminase/D-cysteine desulfhydrase n=1 Tax=Parapedobacter sp. SGR-10 TaxID=2710879 RepID=UPI0013D0A6D3|nr:pyridoxal-phosphate dependent enzyme [Parapedobacter sp. SGR-10]NGF57130.1 pyridoxal-phosphate dependent enzyme [Parapedobacter sp. SGR-10]